MNDVQEQLLQELITLQQEIEQEQAEQDAKMKHQGMTHKITFWHHKNRGDDEQGDMYLSDDPSKILNQVKGWSMKDIRSAKRSAKQKATKLILDIAIKSKGDYQVINL